MDGKNEVITMKKHEYLILYYFENVRKEYNDQNKELTFELHM